MHTSAIINRSQPCGAEVVRIRVSNPPPLSLLFGDVSEIYIRELLFQQPPN